MILYYSMIRKFVQNMFKTKEYKVLLGRWGNHGKDIKSIYANHDHCGDTICKNPKIVTTYIKKELSEKKNK